MANLKKIEAELDQLYGAGLEKLQEFANRLAELERELNDLDFKQLKKHMRDRWHLQFSRFEGFVRAGRGEISVALLVSKMPDYIMPRIDSGLAQQLVAEPERPLVEVADLEEGRSRKKSLSEMTTSEWNRVCPSGETTPISLERQRENLRRKERRPDFGSSDTENDIEEMILSEDRTILKFKDPSRSHRWLTVEVQRVIDCIKETQILV